MPNEFQKRESRVQTVPVVGIRVRAAQKLVDRRAEARPQTSLLVLIHARRLARRRPRLGVHRISHVHLPQIEIVVETDKDLEATVAVAADRGIGVKDAATRGRVHEGDFERDIQGE